MAVVPPITTEDVDRVHRVGRRTSPSGSANPATDESNHHRSHASRQILIKFSSYRSRQRVILKRNSLRGSSIFLNENLTRSRNTLFFKARQLKSKGYISDVWTHDGAIIFKDNDRKIHAAHSLGKAEEIMKSFSPTHQN